MPPFGARPVIVAWIAFDGVVYPSVSFLTRSQSTKTADEAATRLLF